MDRTELLQSMDSAHAPIAAAARALPDAALLGEAPGMPGWTRKDVLAHIEFWHEHSTNVLAGLRTGVDPYPEDEDDEPFDIDRFNDRILQENRHRSAADVRAGEAESFDRLRAAVDGATDHELFDSGLVPWLTGTAAAVVASDTFDHYPEHFPHLRSG